MAEVYPSDEPQAFDLIPLDFDGPNALATPEEHERILLRRYQVAEEGPAAGERAKIASMVATLMYENDLLGTGGGWAHFAIPGEGLTADLASESFDPPRTLTTDLIFMVDPVTGSSATRIVRNAEVGSGTSFCYVISHDVTFGHFDALFNVSGQHISDDPSLTDLTTADTFQIGLEPDGSPSLELRYSATPLTVLPVDLQEGGGDLPEPILLSDPSSAEDQRHAYMVARDFLRALNGQPILSGSFQHSEEIVLPWMGDVRE